MLRLAQAYKNLKDGQKKENYKQDINNANLLGTFLIILLVQILFGIFAMYTLIKCSSAHLLPIWLSILLSISFFIPDIGFFTSIGVITYYFISCKK